MSPPAALPAHLLHLITLNAISNSNFNSAQTSASLALTDVLARYISLLASTAGEYANLTGRTQVGVWDGIAAVSEHGGRWEDLMGWLAEVGEGTGRLGGLEALGAYLADGLHQDPASNMVCHYGDVPDALTHEFNKRHGLRPESDSEEEEDDNMDVDAEGSPSSSAMFIEDSASPESSDEFGSTGWGKMLSKPSFAYHPPSSPVVAEGSFVDPELERFGRVAAFLPPLPSSLSSPSVAAQSSSIQNASRPLNGVKKERQSPLLASTSEGDPSASSSSAMPSFLLPAAHSTDTAAPPVLPSPSAVLLPPREPVPTTLPALKAAHKHLRQVDRPSYMSASNPKRFRAAVQLGLHSNFTVTPSVFGSLAVPPPRFIGIMPSHSIDPTKPTPTPSRPVAIIPQTMTPAMAYKESRMLSSLATLHGPAMAEKKTRMEWPEPLVGDRGEPVFYGPEVEATTVIVAPEEEDAGDEEYLEDDMDETNKHVGPREVSVKVRATWDTPSRHWSDAILPVEKRRKV